MPGHSELLATVELRVEFERWPAGTVGTIVEVFDDGALVEISDERGHTLQVLALPHNALRPIQGV